MLGAIEGTHQRSMRYTDDILVSHHEGADEEEGVGIEIHITACPFLREGKSANAGD